MSRKNQIVMKKKSLSDRWNGIRSARNTDVYFQRAARILEEKGIRKKVAGEVRTTSLPRKGDWGVLTGVEEIVALMEGIPVDVFGLPEGTLFSPGIPVLRIEGNYLDMGVHETSLLGMLCQASGIATQASRFRRIARDKTLISFGARRMHPLITSVIDRNAFIGGFDGVSFISSAEELGLEPMGTMPHSYVLLVGDTVQAARFFHEVMPLSVKRVVLVDTFNDEKFESLRVAEALGKHLFAVRLDTPGSRRGNFLEICREVRWELDLRGFQHVRIFLSGGIDEQDLRTLSPMADGFGIGTSLSNAQTVDFAFDLIEIEGKPISKKGKLSGRKDVFRCTKCLYTEVVPLPKKAGRCPHCRKALAPLLVPHLKGGKRVRKVEHPKQVRDYVLGQLAHLPEPEIGE